MRLQLTMESLILIEKQIDRNYFKNIQFENLFEYISREWVWKHKIDELFY